MRIRSHGWTAGLVAGVALTGLVGPGTAVAESAAVTGTFRVSVSVVGADPNDESGTAARAAISAQGHVVAFDSIATNLVVGDTNQVNDVFVRDAAAGVVERISVADGGQQGDGDSTRPAISGSGRLVVFESTASNLVSGDSNHSPDIFVRDRQTDRTARVSVLSSGVQPNGASLTPAISGNGRYVAFASDATNLVPDPVPEATRNIYVRDLVTGLIELISRRTDGTAAIDGSVPAISADGRYVAFGSFDSQLVAGDTNGIFDVFVRDRLLQRTTRVNVTSSGAQALGGDSFNPAISDDGQRVAFASDAVNLVPGDTNATTDVFVHDSVTGQTERVNVGPGGLQANGQSVGPGIRGGTVFGPDISGNGRFVTFDSIATNLVPGDTNTCTFVSGPSFPAPGQCPDVFVHDRVLDTTYRVNVNSAGTQANDASTDPAISADGHSVVYLSTASNLAAGDTNTCNFPLFTSHPGQCPDIYLTRR